MFEEDITTFNFIVSKEEEVPISEFLYKKFRKLVLNLFERTLLMLSTCVSN
jgi:hypothetical protein